MLFAECIHLETLCVEDEIQSLVWSFQAPLPPFPPSPLYTSLYALSLMHNVDPAFLKPFFHLLHLYVVSYYLLFKAKMSPWGGHLFLLYV